MTHTKAQLLTLWNHRVTVSQRASCLDRVHPVTTLGYREGYKFSEGASAKWIFDVEIEKLRAEIFFTFREDQNHALCRWKTIKRAFETNNILYFIFKFPEMTFYDFSLAPHQNIYISAK